LGHFLAPAHCPGPKERPGQQQLATLTSSVKYTVRLALEELINASLIFNPIDDTHFKIVV
jgi:hypothetical protein